MEFKEQSIIVGGIDGTRLGWILVEWGGPGLTASAYRLSSIDELKNRRSGLARVAVDMPIGLTEHATKGGRLCEILVRKELGRPRRSSVFSSPARCALRAASYEEAGALNRGSSSDQIGISKQTYALFPKLNEVDAFVGPTMQNWIFEVHPEFCFHLMNNSSPLQFAKKRVEGRQERLDLLTKVGFKYVEKVLEKVADLGAASDDLLDACAAAWTAHRFEIGEATRIPESPEKDSRGLNMEIWG